MVVPMLGPPARADVHLLRLVVATTLLACQVGLARALELGTPSQQSWLLSNFSAAPWTSWATSEAVLGASDSAATVYLEAHALGAWLASLLTNSPYQSVAACCAVFFVAVGSSTRGKASPGDAIDLLASHPLLFTPARRGAAGSRQSASGRGKGGARAGGPRRRAGSSTATAPVDWRQSVTDADLDALRSSLASDEANPAGQGWEEVLVRNAPGIQYTAWRRPAPCGGGVSEWKGRTVYTDVSASDLEAFQLDSLRRQEWDSGVECFARLDGPAAAATPAADGNQVSLEFWRMAFPAPFASRDYVCARRVWRAAGDGGATYVVSKVPPGRLAGELEEALPEGRAHRVTTYFSGARVRPLPEGGSELTTVYYEDSGISPGMVEWAVRRSLWSFVEKHAQALRQATPGSRGGSGQGSNTAAQAGPVRIVPRRSHGGRFGLRAAVRTLRTYATAIGRSVVAAALAGEHPDAKAQRRAQRAAAAQARRAARAKTGRFDPVASILGNVRPLKVRVGESIKRRASAALHAGATHIEAERARKRAREEQWQREGHRGDPGAAFRGKLLMVAAAVALKVLHKRDATRTGGGRELGSRR